MYPVFWHAFTRYGLSFFSQDGPIFTRQPGERVEKGVPGPG